MRPRALPGTSAWLAAKRDARLTTGQHKISRRAARKLNLEAALAIASEQTYVSTTPRLVKRAAANTQPPIERTTGAALAKHPDRSPASPHRHQHATDYPVPISSPAGALP